MSAERRPSAVARLAGRLGPFRHKPFSVYWAGGFVSNLGTWLQTVAASVFVYDLTGSVVAVGILNFSGFLPTLVLAIPGGMIADRYDRRVVVGVSSVLALGVSLVLTALAFAGEASEIAVIGATVAINTLWALSKPALIALIPALVPREEVAEAVGLNALQFIFGQIVGPILATAILLTAGVPWAFLINALTFLGPAVAVLYLARLGLGGHARAAAGTSAADVPSGAVAYVREHGWVLALLTGVVACAAPLELTRTLSPAFVEALGEPESAAGVIVAAQSAGSAIGVSLFVPLRRRGWARPLTLIALALQAVGLVGAAVAPNIVLASLAVGLVGLGFSLTFPVLTGTLQEQVPDAVRGRILAFHQMAHLGNRPFTALLSGALAGVVGAQAALLGGVLLAPIGVVAVRSAWRRLSSDTPAAATEALPAAAPGP